MEENNDTNAPVKKKRCFCFCPICNRGFRDNYSLRRHQKKHIKRGELEAPTDFTLTTVEACVTNRGKYFAERGLFR